VRVRSIKAWI